MNNTNDTSFRNIASYDTDNESDNSEDELIPRCDTDERGIHNGLQAPNVSKDVSSPVAPADRYNMIYIIFFIQGVGMLLPYNFFITAKSYFDYKFKDTPKIDRKFENAFALAAMFPNLISVFLNIFLTGRLSRGLRIFSCLVIMFLLFILTTVLVKIDSHKWTENFFALTVVSVVAINLSTGIFQGTIFGVAGIMGSKYIQAVMSGQAVAGIFAAFADLITKLADYDGTHPTQSAFIYFLIAAFVILVTALAYSTLMKLPRMQFFLNRAKCTVQSKAIVEKKEKYIRVPYLVILKQIIPLALSVASVFTVTLAMFPAVISQIESVHQGNQSRWNNDLFPTLVCFLVFNCGDWCGRIVAGRIQIVSGKGIWLPLLCLSRVVFIPLFLICKMKDSYLPTIFKHDIWPVLINLVFSISNGYLGSLCMMYGPRLVDMEYAETASTIMSLFLTVGLTMGACISFAF